MAKTPNSPSTESGNISSIDDDGSIHFRPSPNFKHMKKYLKSKFEEDMNKRLKLEVVNKVEAVAQPPLPPNSPPPEGPLGIVKQEVKDKEYEYKDNESEEYEEEQSSPQETENDKPIMCKDFVRKTCTRGDSCIYSHEIDYSQLKGIYKFCRDFENGRCIRPVCFFVHATTFEKEHFFRSAYLPPHTLAHNRISNFTHSPNEGHQELFRGPLQPPQPDMAPAPMGPPHGAVLAPRAVMPQAPLPPPLKPEYHPYYISIKTTGSPPRVFEAKDMHARKCNCCELSELRLQHSKAQMAQAMKSSREMDDKLELVMKKNNRLHSVLRLLLKQRLA